jgi:DNA-binding Lrp family transcriptional regulator
MSLAQLAERKEKSELYNRKFDVYSQATLTERPTTYLTRRSLELLRLLSEGGVRKTVQVYEAKQRDLANKFGVSRQALSLQLRRLKEKKLIQVGRGFVSLTEEGRRTIGHNLTPTIVTVSIAPQKRSEAVEKIKTLPATQIYRVTGQVDIVLILEQQDLNHVLEVISAIDGVVETQCYVSIETMQGQYR